MPIDLDKFRKIDSGVMRRIFAPDGEDYIIIRKKPSKSRVTGKINYSIQMLLGGPSVSKNKYLSNFTNKFLEIFIDLKNNLVVLDGGLENRTSITPRVSGYTSEAGQPSRSKDKTKSPREVKSLIFTDGRLVKQTIFHKIFDMESPHGESKIFSYTIEKVQGSKHLEVLVIDLNKEL